MDLVIRPNQFSVPMYKHIAELRPIIVVPINKQRCFVTRFDIAHTAQFFVRNALWLLIKWRVKTLAIECIADGNEMWRSVLVCCSESCDSLLLHKLNLRLTQSRTIAHDLLLVLLPLTACHRYLLYFWDNLRRQYIEWFQIRYIRHTKDGLINA